MKNWRLFIWAIKRLRLDATGEPVKGLRNGLLWALVDLSGVTAQDVLRFVNK